jgi:hypothetical protein
MLSRRQFVKTAVATTLATPVATVLYTFFVEPHWLQITSPLLPVRNLPPALQGRTLAQLSDLHIGPRVADSYIISTFRTVAQLQPDIVVFTGDWISYYGSDQLGQLAAVLKEAPHGKLATIGILGNHDYGHGWRMLEVADRVAGVAADAGITILRNEACSVDGLSILGVDDYWSPRFGPRPLLDAHGKNPASLALCHNPDAADVPVWEGFHGWILAGHTHGGQCKPPFLPPPLLPVQNRRYTSGEFSLDGGRKMYISRGVGHLLKVRFNARPEVPLFRLTRAEI